jgi:hypothetical protein
MDKTQTAPVRIWVTESIAIKNWLNIPSLNRKPRIEYVRADLSQATIDALSSSKAEVVADAILAALPDYDTQQATIDALTAALEAFTDVCGERKGVWKGMRWIDGDELEEAWGKARAALASPTG